ncbi:MAG: FdrA family protein [Chloroflexota bacterium]
MTLRWVVRPNIYYDSVKLMRVSEALSNLPGVVRAAAVMATPLNLELLTGDNLLPAGQFTPDDLLISIRSDDDAAADAALAASDAMLTAAPAPGIESTSLPLFHALEQSAPPANVAIIAVPGPSATVEALAAIRAGLHVFLFSDNVSLEHEVQLKRMAAPKNLLVMGPDCGTSILQGVGFGFANRVEAGPVGIVGASGTGIQQVCCLLDEIGIGIRQAIGTGGRDLSAAVGGMSTAQALRFLDADPHCEILLIVSKSPDGDAAIRLHDHLSRLSKPAVACLLGSSMKDRGNVRYARTLTDAARLVAENLALRAGDRWTADSVPRHHPSFRSRVYGLFAGGTLCSEAELILDDMVVSHHLVDLGDDRYTQGRAHPMIDPRLRASGLAELGRHADAGAVLFDVVLGDLAHPDPAGAVIPALRELSGYSKVHLVASLIGSRRDPQNVDAQRSALEQEGVHVFSSNAAAAAAAGALVGGA